MGKKWLVQPALFSRSNNLHLRWFYVGVETNSQPMGH